MDGAAWSGSVGTTSEDGSYRHAAQCFRERSANRHRQDALQGSSLKRALTGGGGDLGGLAQALEQHAQKLGLKQENRVDWGSQ